MTRYWVPLRTFHVRGILDFPSQYCRRKRRVILDLSYPEGSAVNNRIPKNSKLGSHVNLIIPRVQDLVALVKGAVFSISVT